MTRYSKIILSITNICVFLGTIVICKDSYETINKCENLWGICVGSGLASMLLLFDSLPKICSDKKIIWTSYCCIPIPYTIIIYLASIAMAIYQVSIYSSLNKLCLSYYKDNYNYLNILCILQFSNIALNILLFM
jgi:hypothetical protein